MHSSAVKRKVKACKGPHVSNMPFFQPQQRMRWRWMTASSISSFDPASCREEYESSRARYKLVRRHFKVHTKSREIVTSRVIWYKLTELWKVPRSPQRPSLEWFRAPQTTQAQKNVIFSTTHTFSDRMQHAAREPLRWWSSLSVRREAGWLSTPVISRSGTCIGLRLSAALKFLQTKLDRIKPGTSSDHFCWSATVKYSQTEII